MFMGSEQRAELDTLDQRLNADDIMALAKQENEANEIAKRIRHLVVIPPQERPIA